MSSESILRQRSMFALRGRARVGTCSFELKLCIRVQSYTFWEINFLCLVARQMNLSHHTLWARRSQICIICFWTSLFVYHYSYRIFFKTNSTWAQQLFGSPLESPRCRSLPPAHEQTDWYVDFSATLTRSCKAALTDINMAGCSP